MPSPDVTITLGRSGQIVKRKHSGSGDGFSSFGNKRQRGYGSQQIRDDDGSDGMHLGHNDLRLKLMRRRASEGRTTRASERRTDVRGENSAAARSSMNSNMLRRDLEPRERSHVTRAAPHGSGRSSLYIGSRNMYSTRDDLRPRSPTRSQRTSRSVSPSPYRKELQNIPRIRSIDTSSARHVSRTDVLDPSRSAVPAHLMVPIASEAVRPGTQIPPSNGGMQRSLYMGEVPLTVASLLSSLGLGKYAIHFQAEEVDMMALRQMGEKDLKDIGIPMGPRKKILQALMALSRRQQQQPRQL